jgi:predicted nuclease with TOPRIM domain
MKDRISTRLQQLRTEYQKGQERLVVLEQEASNVKSSMLRISGAIQVLEELLEQDPSALQDKELQSNHIEADSSQ